MNMFLDRGKRRRSRGYATLVVMILVTLAISIGMSNMVSLDHLRRELLLLEKGHAEWWEGRGKK